MLVLLLWPPSVPARLNEVALASFIQTVSPDAD